MLDLTNNPVTPLKQKEGETHTCCFLWSKTFYLFSPLKTKLKINTTLFSPAYKNPRYHVGKWDWSLGGYTGNSIRVPISRLGGSARGGRLLPAAAHWFPGELKCCVSPGGDADNGTEQHINNLCASRRGGWRVCRCGLFPAERETWKTAWRLSSHMKSGTESNELFNNHKQSEMTFYWGRS